MDSRDVGDNIPPSAYSLLSDDFGSPAQNQGETLILSKTYASPFFSDQTAPVTAVALCFRCSK